MTLTSLLKVIRPILRIACYLALLTALALLAKGGVNLIYSVKIPFGMSETVTLLISCLLAGLFLFIGVLLVLHFFKSSDS